jgi:tetraacyldisaccharide 4'-kinase
VAARAGLGALAGIYGGVISAYRAAYDRGLFHTVAADCRVISVGNLTVGGTGKSTLVRWLAGALHARGVPVAVLSYGYQAQSAAPVTVVSDGRRVLVPASVCGDEPRMLADALPGVPVIIGKRRQLSAAAAVQQFGVRACVLDDAFQYWRLVKDLDLVLLDALCPFGGGQLLPRGLLREAPRQLRRAHAVILTNAHRLSPDERGALREQIHSLSPRAVLAEARHAARPLRPLVSGRWAAGSGQADHSALSTALCSLAGQRVLALSSLGNPAGFEQLLRELGAEVVSARYPDHHAYHGADLQREEERARSSDCSMIVTTEKDAVKIEPEWIETLPVWILPVEMEFDTSREELETLLEAKIR